jgi:patatin-like phospholipase/acyl hydrolase
MNGSDGGPPAEGKFFRILSLDGSGIRGVFPAAFLARLEEHLEHPIGRYFDLIAGTSTGGIIAIGLGLGLSAGDILKLYVEQGPAIFDQEHGAVENWVRQKLRGMAHLFVTKHSSEPLRHALEGVLGRRKIGESRTRLVIPAWHPVLERVYIYKTAHHPRLETDYKQPAIDAAMATAAAPTFLKPHMTESAVELVDGGVWANNPIGVAAIEAIGMLGWPGDRLKILSIGTINEPGRNQLESVVAISRCAHFPATLSALLPTGLVRSSAHCLAAA